MNAVSQSAQSPHSQLEAEYTQANENFRLLTEIRFKLLAFLPTFGGVAVFALSFAGLSAGGPSQNPAHHELWLVALISVLGFVATLGITVYDQRNSELYNALVHRLKYLEEMFQSSPSPRTLRGTVHGGQFQERPEQYRRLFGLFKMGHDRGLALVYGPVLGAWVFPLAIAGLQLSWVSRELAIPLAGVMSLLGCIVCTWELVRQDRADRKRWRKAGEQLPNGTMSPDTGTTSRIDED